jgi:hypothetical protein
VASQLSVPELLRLQVKALRGIFNNESEEDLGQPYLLNSVLFYCLLCAPSDSGDGESLPLELSYLVKKQPLRDTVELVEVLGALVDVAATILHDPRQQQALDVIRAVLYSGWTRVAKIVIEQDPSLEAEGPAHRDRPLLGELLPVARQREIVDFCQKNSLSAVAAHDWLVHKNRESYVTIL